MTLLETLIAMSLLVGLLVIIFGLFRDLSYIQDQDQRDYKQSFYDGYIELRLNDVFSHLMNENIRTTKARPFRFYTEQNGNLSTSPSLVFKYNNGVRIDPLFSSDVLGRLYVDNDQNELRLVSWPLHTTTPSENMFNEILLKDVEKMDLEFLSVGVENGTTTTQANIDKRGQWLSSWEKSYGEMPIIMKIKLTMKNDLPEKNYIFVLPTSRYAINMSRT